jgi:hypothetical protein
MTDTTALLQALAVARAALTETAISRESDPIDDDDAADAVRFRDAFGTLSLFTEAITSVRQDLGSGTATLAACLLKVIETKAQQYQLLDHIADLRRDLAAAEAARDEARIMYCDAEAEAALADKVSTGPEAIAEEHGWQYLLPMLADRPADD